MSNKIKYHANFMSDFIALINDGKYLFPMNESDIDALFDESTDFDRAERCTLEMITLDLPYVFEDHIRDLDISEEARDDLREKFVSFVASSVTEILQFEMSEY